MKVEICRICQRYFPFIALYSEIYDILIHKRRHQFFEILIPPPPFVIIFT